MKNAVKKNGILTFAYCLGVDDILLSDLFQAGLLRKRDNLYEVFSQEALNDGNGCGEIVPEGYYIKLDSAGYPYPNDPAFFVENHRHVSGNCYEQIPTPRGIWTADSPWCEEMQFLVEKKGLVIRPGDPDNYFSAPLWGTVESAASDAVVLFYSIERDDIGVIRNIDFNFVVRTEFDKTYQVPLE